MALTWPVALDPSVTLPRSPFGPSFAWSLRIVPDALLSGEFPWRTREAGWPWLREARFLGWVPLIVGTALAPFARPVTVFNLLLLASMPLSALAGALWIRRGVPGVGPVGLLLGAVTYACSVHLVSNLANGEIAKAWGFLVPLALLALDAASRSWRRMPLAALALLAVVFTDPYAFFCVAAAAPFVVGRRPERGDLGRWAACLALIGLAAWAGGAYFRIPHDGWNAVFAPSSSPIAARVRMGAPYPSAPLAGLFWPPWEEVPSGTLHGTWLGWTVVVLALLGARRAWREDRPATLRAVGLSAAGVVLALGPWLFLLPDRPAVAPLPAWIVQWIMPDRWGGMYYRFLHVGLLGLALLVARVRVPAWVAAGALLAAAAELHAGIPLGWPLPLEPPPPASLVEDLRRDPIPGAVALLPAYPPGESVSAAAFALAAHHERPITALPRRPSFPDEYPPNGVELDRCVEGGACQVSPALEEALERQGVRFVVLRTGAPFDTGRLREVLTRRLGRPRTDTGYAWWTVAAATPEQVAEAFPGPPPSPPDARLQRQDRPPPDQPPQAPRGHPTWMPPPEGRIEGHPRGPGAPSSPSESTP